MTSLPRVVSPDEITPDQPRAGRENAGRSASKKKKTATPGCYCPRCQATMPLAAWTIERVRGVVVTIGDCGTCGARLSRIGGASERDGET